MDTHTARLRLQADAGEKIWLGGIGVDFKISGGQSGGAVAVVEHPIEAGRLVPPHVHHGEDEYSYIVTGRIGARIGDEIIEAGPGDYVLKPRDVPHTFWNPGPQPARLIEIIAPAGFERFFVKLGELFSTCPAQEFASRRAALGANYHLEFVDEWTEQLKQAYGLKLLGE
jgi:mannose-6-phosphate isomerase-like protein (cupin superfamily)